MTVKDKITQESIVKGKGIVLSIPNSVFGKLDENEECNIRYTQGYIDISKLFACFNGQCINKYGRCDKRSNISYLSTVHTEV